MRVIKPLRLGLLTRPYSLRGQHRLGVSVMAWATLSEAAVLLPESEMWEAAQSVLDEDEALDLGIPKPCGEFLVSGRAWAHDPAQTGTCAVSVRVGSLEKSLIVSGDRQWTGGASGKPAIGPAQPVVGVPVDWHHTYGGKDVEENPVGVGADAASRALPNVEPLEGRMTRPGQPGVPVSFGPVSPIRPRRFARAGKYDEKWLTHGFPGLPDTLDPHFFNTASPDQWWTGQDGVDSALDYDIWNMHPTQARLSGRLPDWRARCFVIRAQPKAVPQAAPDLIDRVASLESVALRLTTVWFFPDRERVLLMFQGSCTCATDDGADIELIMPALEDAGATGRPDAHYRQTLANRLEPEHGALYALRDSDLVPAHAMRDMMTEGSGGDAMNRPQVVNQRERGRLLREDMLQRAQAMGHDAAEYPLEGEMPGLATLDDLPHYVRGMRRRTREAKVRMGRAQRENDARLSETFAPESKQSMAQLKQDAKAPPAGGPPTFGAPGAEAELLDQARQADAAPDSPMSVQALQATIAQARHDLSQLYRHAAHHQAPAEQAPGGRSKRMRRRVETLMQGSRDLSGLDLTGVDLSGMDLSAARAHGVWMEGANLSGVSLAGTDLLNAVLTRAELAGTCLDGTNLTGANLGHVQATSATFMGARFDATVLDGAQLSGCDLSQSRWSDCMPAGATLIDCVLAQAELDNVVFWQDARLARCRFDTARLNRVVWLDCTLEALAFHEAALVACAWVQVDFESPLHLAHARLETCCAVDCDLSGAVFTDAHLTSCNFRGLLMDHADFSRARLMSCDLSQASLRQAVFQAADAKESLFMGCDLTAADFRDADLIDALMQKSDYRLTDLRGANLFRTDISQSRLDDSTRTTGAYIKQVKTLPRATPAAPAPATGARS